MKRPICILLSLLFAAFGLSAENLELRTVVIDPGHGGKDPGCVSADRKTLEKSLTLDISQALAAKIRSEYPGVKVILTRSKDEYLTLNARADKANKADAQLFISIHINSAANKSANGYSVHVLGQSSSPDKDLFAYNMDVCKRENSVIMLEEDYSTKYQGFDPSDPESFIFMALMQNSHLEQSLKFAQLIKTKLGGGALKSDRGLWQNAFYVLWKTSMPAVLVELGFISNSSDLAALKLKSNRDALAQRLFAAFREYKTQYDDSMRDKREVSSTGPSSLSSSDLSKNSETKAADDSAEKYGVQIFALSRELPSGAKEFLGYRAEVLKVGNLYKYYIGISTSKEEARREHEKIKKHYPQSYVVKLK